MNHFFVSTFNPFRLDTAFTDLGILQQVRIPGDDALLERWSWRG